MANFKTIISSIIAVLVLLSVAPTLIKTISSNYKSITKPVAQVARVSIKGQINSTQFYLKHITAFFKDTNIKAIVLDIDSPGGVVGSTQALYYEILKLKKKYPKPIVSQVDNCCASGAYYIAAATDYIVAPPSAIIGSIGVYMKNFNYKKLLDYLKVKQKIKQSGKYKTTFDPYSDNDTSEMEAMIQHLCDDTYDQFVKDVAAQRGILVKKKNEWADGKIFSAREAQRLGLINKTGTACDIEDKVKALANIDSEIIWMKPVQPSVFSQLMGAQEANMENIIKSSIKELVQEINNDNYSLRAQL